MKLGRILGGCLVLCACLLPWGCGADRECVELCEEGQSGNCTSIDGDCGEFCEALLAVEAEAGSADERATYEDCLNEDSDVCANSCDSEELALSTTIGNFCLANSSRPECTVLVAAF